jgi:hypothetical protein
MEPRMKVVLAAVLALILGANGLVMLFAGPWWYSVVPGVTMTGPYNPHFVKDIGAAYLVVAGALAWRAARPTAGQGALVAAAAFLILHAFIHVADAAVGGHAGHDLIRDLGGIYLPALITAWLAWTPKRSTP